MRFPVWGFSLIWFEVSLSVFCQPSTFFLWEGYVSQPFVVWMPVFCQLSAFFSVRRMSSDDLKFQCQSFVTLLFFFSVGGVCLELRRIRIRISDVLFPVSQWSCLPESLKVPCQVNDLCSEICFAERVCQSLSLFWSGNLSETVEVSLPLFCLFLMTTLSENGPKCLLIPRLLLITESPSAYKKFDCQSLAPDWLHNPSARGFVLRYALFCPEKAIKTECKHCVFDSLEYVPRVSQGLWLMLFSWSLVKSVRQFMGFIISHFQGLSNLDSHKIGWFTLATTNAFCFPPKL